MKIAILINASIRKFSKIEKIIKTGFANYNASFFISNYAGHFKELCRQALNSSHDCFIFVGGDGSLNEGINGVIDYYKSKDSQQPDDYDWQAISQIKMGVYAAGSGNDFIKSLDIDESMATLIANIDQGTSQMVDIGWINYRDFNDKPDVSFFINVTDIGVGGEVVKAKSKMPKWINGQLTYLFAITSTIARYKKGCLKASNKDFEWSGKALSIVVANAKYFGSSLGVAPDADVSDGMFDLVIVGNINFFEYLKNMGNLKQCKKLTHSEISYRKVNEITLDSTDDCIVSIDMDGELLGKTPVTLKCLTKRINFIC